MPQQKNVRRARTWPLLRTFMFQLDLINMANGILWSFGNRDTLERGDFTINILLLFHYYYYFYYFQIAPLQIVTFIYRDSGMLQHMHFVSYKQAWPLPLRHVQIIKEITIQKQILLVKQRVGSRGSLILPFPISIRGKMCFSLNNIFPISSTLKNVPGSRVPFSFNCM